MDARYVYVKRKCERMCVIVCVCVCTVVCACVCVCVCVCVCGSLVFAISRNLRHGYRISYLDKLVGIITQSPW